MVVDSTADADAVLTTFSKRTRKNVNLATAKQAAAGAGVPLLVLPAVSAQRLVEAVGPLMGLPTTTTVADYDASPVGGVASSRLQAGRGGNQQGWQQQEQEQ